MIEVFYCNHKYQAKYVSEKRTYFFLMKYFNYQTVNSLIIYVDQYQHIRQRLHNNTNIITCSPLFWH